MVCPACAKRVPYTDQFCAYCGTAIARRFPLPWAWRGQGLPRPALTTGAWGGVVGALGGWFLGTLMGETLLGMLLGALAVGASAALGDGVAGLVLDRRSAERFGLALGALGGASTALGAFVIAPGVVLWAGDWSGWRGLWAMLAGGLYLGLFSALGGAIVGAGLGMLAGRFAAPAGRSFGRRGIVVGAALAWTLGAALGGAFAGDYAGRIAGADTAAAAALGAALQLLIGLLALSGVRRLVRQWRGWWSKRRP